MPEPHRDDVLPAPGAPLPRRPVAPPLEGLVALCERLERAGIPAWIQGEAWLDARLGVRSPRKPAQSLLCLAPAERVLSTLPSAVVTAESARRLGAASADGPIDLIPVGARSIDVALLGFGLAPLAMAWRPLGDETSDPGDVGPLLEKGEFPLLRPAPNPFAAAPRRYWIAARLLAEHGLTPTSSLVEAARDVLPEIETRMPEGAPVRRALARVLAAEAPSGALRFLREAGALGRLLPDYEAGTEARIDALPPGSALRWAALLRGPNTGEALARLRVPQALARHCLRLNEAHPLDGTNAGARDPQIRRLVNRFRPDELDALVAWRRLELETPESEAMPSGTAGAQRRLPPRELELARTRLAKVETAIARVRAQAAASDSVRSLALGGGEVMRILGARPGRQVGLALEHLAAFVAADPARNTAAQLEEELQAWKEAGFATAIR